MSATLRIVVTGLVATYPFGGVFWDYMHYLLGLFRLGHDVLYVEDTGMWCYHPLGATFVEDGTRNASYLARHIGLFEPALRDRWFYRDVRGQDFGRPWEEVKRFCRSADLFLNISASCLMRDEYFAARRVALIDTDPMYTQVTIPRYMDGAIDEITVHRVKTMKRHDVFFTFAENIGAPDCLIPTELFRWIPTRQPIVLDCFENAIVPLEERRRVLTTVASWGAAERDIEIKGVPYRGKYFEFERFSELASRSDVPLELALSGDVPFRGLQELGWRVLDAYKVSRDPWVYQSYLARSFGEWSVAKHAYVASKSGWFSCRSACYLALGVPVVAQDTGFSRILPCGKGVLAFETLEDARDAIESLKSSPEKHCEAARAIASAYFDSRLVLKQLLEKALEGQ